LPFTLKSQSGYYNGWGEGYFEKPLTKAARSKLPNFLSFRLEKASFDLKLAAAAAAAAAVKVLQSPYFGSSNLILDCQTTSYVAMLVENFPIARPAAAAAASWPRGYSPIESDS
jgi:hypothetical protein